MIAQNVFPANQGFPRPPDGGILVPTPFDASPPAKQAFAPAPTVSLFPIEPTPPSKPFLPASQAVGPIPSNSQVIPPAMEVVVADTPTASGDAPTYIVTEQGSIATVPQQAIVSYTIVSVTDYDTGLPPDANSINIKIVLNVGNAPLSSYGFSFAGRTLYFTSGTWIPLGTTPQRPILVNGDNIVVVPNAASNGTTTSLYKGTGLGVTGPQPGDSIAVDTARSESEVLFQNLGLVQNVVPNTSPLLDPSGAVTSDQPVQDANVSDQATSIGTPVDYFQTNHHPI
jgi:hypothetical protein